AGSAGRGRCGQGALDPGQRGAGHGHQALRGPPAHPGVFPGPGLIPTPPAGGQTAGSTRREGASVMKCLDNLLLNTDSYKASHWLQYPPGTDATFFYVESRGGTYDRTV